ncbi:MAG TPA: ABC transporter substrate-binding protein [Chitinophagaceae bacterium]|nr:ABC transporter substrate-binding protein [Chitinophagaceae bacterium]
MNIGILFPRSNTYPLIGSDFLEGIKAFIKKESSEKEINFFIESIGFGGMEKEVYAKTEKLLMLDDVDLLVAFIDEKILELVKPLLLASGKLVLVVNTGANHPVNWVPQSNILHLNLQHSFLCAVTGSSAAQDIKNKYAAVCSSFYDCGYLHISSIVSEFQNSGGIVKHNYINNQKVAKDFEFPEIIEYLKNEDEIKTLLAVFDSQPAGDFYKALNESTITDLQLFVSPMMLESKALEKINLINTLNISGYIPWHNTIPGNVNEDFISFYTTHFKKQPSQFSVLGWETGIVIIEILRKHFENLRDGETVVKQFNNSVLNSPRGKMKLDTKTQYFLLPAIRCTISPGNSKLELEYNIDLENEWEEFSEKNTEGTVSGWTNTYLCY